MRNSVPQQDQLIDINSDVSNALLLSLSELATNAQKETQFYMGLQNLIMAELPFCAIEIELKLNSSNQLFKVYASNETLVANQESFAFDDCMEENILLINQSQSSKKVETVVKANQMRQELAVKSKLLVALNVAGKPCGRIAFYLAKEYVGLSSQCEKTLSIVANICAQFIKSKNDERKSLLNNAIDIDNSLVKSKQEEQKKAAEKVLLTIAELANSSMNLHDFYLEMHKQIGLIVYAENFYVVKKVASEDGFQFEYYCDAKDKKSLSDLNKLPQSIINQSLTGFILQQKNSLLLDDNGLADLQKTEGIVINGPTPISWLGVPLVLDAEVFGVMVLQSYIPEKKYTLAEKQLMEYVAKSVANAIQRKANQTTLENLVKERTYELEKVNSVLLKEIEEKTRAQKIQNALYEISNVAYINSNIYEFYSKIHQILRSLFYAENFYVAILDDTKKSLVFDYFSDIQDKELLQDKVIGIDEKLLSAVLFNRGETLLLDKESFESLQQAESVSLVGSMFESWLGVLLKADDQPIGILVVQSYDAKEKYTAWHKNLLEYVAQHISSAFARKQHQDELERKVLSRTQELEREIEFRKQSETTKSALYEIANLANMDLKLEHFYRELHYIISQLVYCENFYIALKEPNSEGFKMVYFVDTVDEFNIESISAMSEESLSNSLTAYVMRKGESILATNNDIVDLQQRNEITAYGPETLFWLGVPLFIDNQVIGIMTLQSYLADKSYNLKDKELMIFVAQHVASAIQRQRRKDYLQMQVKQRTHEINEANVKLKKQYDKAERARNIQTALFEITDLASSAKNADEIYVKIHQIISRLIYAENFYICLLSENDQSIDFVYFVDQVDELDKEALKKIPSESIRRTSTGIVLASGKSLLRTPDSEESKHNKSYIGLRSLYWLGVPLKVDDVVLGVVAIQSYDAQHKIGLEEKELLEFVSHHIALTLERQRAQINLERRVVERTRKLAETNQYLQQQIIERKRSEAIQSTLYYVSNLASENLSLQDLFANIHSAIGKMVYAENFYVALLDKQTNLLDWVYLVDSNQEYDYEKLKKIPDDVKDKSLARLVVESGDYLNINKKQIKRLVENKKVKLIGATCEYYLGIPLMFSDGAHGVMAVQSYDSTISFSAADEELLVFVAQSIVSTLERRAYQDLLERQVKNRTKELTRINQKLEVEVAQREESEKLQNALYRISETPQECSTDNELYIRLHSIISQLMYAKSFYIVIVNPQQQEFKFEYVADAVDKDIPKSIPFGTSLTHYVYRKKQLVHLNRSQIIALENKGEFNLQGSIPEDWIGVPLMSDFEMIGIMIIQSYDHNYLYGDREIGILSFVSTHISDALQRKRAERELRETYEALAEKTKKAEEASRAKSAFLATVSHEIRTPMNGVLGMLSLLDDTEMNSRQRDYVTKTLTSAKSLLGIINDILDFSKIEEGKMELESTGFNLIEVLDNIMDLFSSKLNEKGISFYLDLDSQVKLFRRGDPLRLSQIIVNLIGNAIKFTNQGFIRLSITEKANSVLHFEVEDTGIGIAKDKREKIFQSFTQADDTTTRKFGGSGLGLSISQQLVNLMGGKIYVDGQQDKGSKFIFEVVIKEDFTNKLPQPVLDCSVFTIVANEESKRFWRNCAKAFQFNLVVVAASEVIASAESISNIVESKLKELSHLFIACDDQSGALNRFVNQLMSKNKSAACVYKLASSQGDSASENEQSATGLNEISLPLKIGSLLTLLNEDYCVLLDEKKPMSVPVKQLEITSKVLLAEDNPINQQVARELLQKAGAKVVIVNNGKEAVEKVTKESFDVVFMDIQMPEMDGIEATKKIREFTNLQSLPIIAMTANVMKGDRSKCIKAGMNDYLGKPIDKFILYSLLEKYTLLKSSNKIDSDPKRPELSSASLSMHPFYRKLIDKFNDEQLVADLATIFTKSHQNDCQKILQYINTVQFDKALECLHKLKGSAGELEMINLVEQIEKIEEKLKDDTTPSKQDVGEFAKSLNSMLALNIP
ncbi:GAF domain-containing protein [Aliikangiella sp. IMCC44653]